VNTRTSGMKKKNERLFLSRSFRIIG
jgi:hypothetical protein